MRNEIADMRDENPRFNEPYNLSEIWPKALRSAHNKAAGTVGRERIDPIDLAWHDVFEADNTLEEK